MRRAKRIGERQIVIHFGARSASNGAAAVSLARAAGSRGDYFRPLALSLFLLLGLCWNSPALAQPPDPIAQTLRDWEARYQRLNSVRYTLSGTAEKMNLPKERKAPRKRPVSYVVLLDFDKKRLRIETNMTAYNSQQDRFIARVNTSAFDGEATRLTAPREINELASKDANAYIWRGNNPHATIEAELWPILMAHGIVPTVNQPALISRWPTKHDSEGFQSRGDVTFENRRCAILRTMPLSSLPALADEFWVDLGRAGAIVRHVYFSGKNPFFRLDIAYQETEYGWLPKSWTFAHTAGELIDVVKLTVDRLEANPALSDADFVLPIASGSLLEVDQYPEPGKGLDTNHPASETFRVDASGKWIKLDEAGFTTIEGKQLPPETRGWRWWWYAAIALGLAAAAFAAVRLRRWTAGSQHG